MDNVAETLTAKVIEYATVVNVIAQVKMNHTIIEKIFKLHKRLPSLLLETIHFINVGSNGGFNSGSRNQNGGFSGGSGGFRNSNGGSGGK